jgi:hypothetical protein
VLKKSINVMLPTAPPDPALQRAIRQLAYELYIKPIHSLDHSGRIINL